MSPRARLEWLRNALELLLLAALLAAVGYCGWLLWREAGRAWGW